MSDNPIFLTVKNRDAAKRILRGGMKAANLPDSLIAELPQGKQPILLDNPGPRTGVLQETLTQNEHGTGRAKVKFHTTDFENSNEEDGIRLKVSEEEVEAYCTQLSDGEAIDADTIVNLVCRNNRWDINLGGGGTRDLEGKVVSESNGTYTIAIYEGTGSKIAKITDEEGEEQDYEIEATTRYLQSGEKLDAGTKVGVTWTATYGYRITHCEY